jgi:tRNA(fMet)-specific endonuclease VapC
VTRLLLDTTFLIDAERSAGALDELIADDDDAAIAAITIAELQVGVHVASGSRQTSRQDFLDAVASTIPVLDYDVAVAAAHAELLFHVRRRGEPRGAHDLIIAATARAAGRTVVTADHAAFDALPGVELRYHR